MEKRVAFLGPEGSFSHEAFKKLGHGFSPIACRSIRDVARRAAEGALGFLPVRNKIIGEIEETVRVFKSARTALVVLRKIKFPISCVLAAKENIPFSRIRTLYAFGAVRDQCGKFIGEKLPKARIFSRVASSSAAIKKVVQLTGKMADESAAIGSEKAVKIYGLKILARGIQDDPEDWTEFLLFRMKRGRRHTTRVRALRSKRK